MKFCELYSICRQHERFFETALKRAEDQTYFQWFQDIDEICKTQQRDKLDAKLPNSICVQALKNYPDKMFISGDRIRSYRMRDDDEEISYLDVYQKYGGPLLEEVLEKGSKEL